VQKNVTVPKATWNRLRGNAQASGVPLCIYLAYLIERSMPVPIDDRENQEELARMEVERDRGRCGDLVTS
jgi:hypothetical protein